MWNAGGGKTLRPRRSDRGHPDTLRFDPCLGLRHDHRGIPRPLRLRSRHARPARLARSSPNGSPWPSLLLQGAIVTIVILSGRVDQILLYAGFTLTLFSAIAVSCVIALRIKAPSSEAISGMGLPLHPPALHLRFPVDNGVGLPRQTGGILPRTGHGGGGRAPLLGVNRRENR